MILITLSEITKKDSAIIHKMLLSSRRTVWYHKGETVYAETYKVQ